MLKRFDAVALGELLIDFTPAGISEQGNVLFERNPGGAPCNVLAQMQKLGKNTCFVGKVGKDIFGYYLKDTLTKIGIATDGLKYSDAINTTLAFVQLDENGERMFSFYRNPGADMMLSEEDIDEDLIKSSKIFQFGSLSMVTECYKKATIKALDIAKRNGLIISYDPNLRLNLWPSKEAAVEGMKIGLPYADIVKISQEELEILSGTSDPVLGSAILSEQYNITIIFVTFGPNGAFYRLGYKTNLLNTFDTKVIDTTGAGDAFLGGVLYHLTNMTIEEIKNLEYGHLDKIVQFANAAGALTATKIGAIHAVPDLAEIEGCMKNKRMVKCE